jgi:hypothetical protein
MRRILMSCAIFALLGCNAILGLKESTLADEGGADTGTALDGTPGSEAGADGPDDGSSQQPGDDDAVTGDGATAGGGPGDAGTKLPEAGVTPPGCVRDASPYCNSCVTIQTDPYNVCSPYGCAGPYDDTAHGVPSPLPSP